MSLHKCMTRRLSHASLVNRLSRHSPCMSLRGNIVTAAITCLLLVLVACGDDDSDFATRPSDGSSLSSSSAMSSGSVYRSGPCKVETDENCFKDDRDGQTYKTVKIGDQVWMAENLNFETDESVCYNDSVEYCDTYGRLYTWGAAMDSAGTWSVNGKGCGYLKTCSPTGTIRGVCPNGWHLPSNAEWETLFNAVGGKTIAGKKLKSTSGWNSSRNGTDAFSFSALPAGRRDDDGNYNYEGSLAYFWSSMELNIDYACFVNLYYDNDDAFLNNYDYKYVGFSVRCLQD